MALVPQVKLCRKASKYDFALKNGYLKMIENGGFEQLTFCLFLAISSAFSSGYKVMHPLMFVDSQNQFTSLMHLLFSFTIYYLVGGLEHVLFFHILGISSSQLTNSYFSEGLLKPPSSINPT